MLDLGSGDGSFLLAAARRGIRGVGFELNPLLWAYSRLRSWPRRQLIDIRWGDYWHQPLPPSDAVYVFLIKRYMPKLDAKLSAELTKPTLLASYAFTIPGKKPLHQRDGIYLYQYGTSRANRVQTLTG